MWVKAIQTDFSHINESIENPRETEKLETIRAIKRITKK